MFVPVTTSTSVVTTVSDSIATITLNRPEGLNAFDATQRSGLLAAVNTLNADDTVKVVIVTGAGRAFCSGADLAEKTPPEQTVEQRLNKEYKPALLGITNAPKPYIAAVNGVAAGIGAALAMACDIVLMHRQAYFYQAFSSIGLLPDGGTSWHLVRQLGPKQAYEMMVMGQKVSAEKCVELGLVNRVVDVESVIDEAWEVALSLTTRAPLSLRYTKQVMHEVMDKTLDQAISIEAKYQLIANQSDDFAEGKSAFLEKRKPVWKGC